MNTEIVSALPRIYYQEQRQLERANMPQKPEVPPGQTVRYDPFSRSWRFYTPKQPKYRVQMDTDELVYLTRRMENARLDEKRFTRVAKFSRARLAQAEAEACQKTIDQLVAARGAQ